jgi:hypothetical protein
LRLFRSAWISECGRYRYRLTRGFGMGPAVTFVMLNPSTADGETDDATIRKCCGFAHRLGYSGIMVVNLFALRASDPAELWKTPQDERCGPLNGPAQSSAICNRDVVLAWGAHARRADVIDQARSLRLFAETNARSVIVLKQLRDGTPAHPLMLPYSCIEVQAAPAVKSGQGDGSRPGPDPFLALTHDRGGADYTG